MDVRSVMMRAVREAADVLLVRRAEARALQYTSEQATQVRALADGALRRVEAARDLTSPRDVSVAAGLYREAIELRLRAANVARVGEPRVLGDEARALVDTDFERATAGRCREMIPLLADVEWRLRGEAEARSVATIRGVRLRRTAALAIALAYVSYGAIARALASPNIAFHKPVIIGGATALNPGELVDGELDPPKPVRLLGAAPTIDIDLGGEYRLDSIRITNRQDEHFDASLPLYVSTAASDGVWSELDVQRIHFRTLSLRAHGRVARYVRVASASRELALNEIEVFGRYAH